MSSLAYSAAKLTPEQYLAEENDGAARHEYVDGALYATSGASNWHSQVASALFTSIYSRLPQCETFIFDMKVKVTSGRSVKFYYPDILVSCSDTEEDAYYREHPVLLIEVLSPTTERTDRTEKFDAYTGMPSLKEYILAAQDIPKIELFRRRTAWKSEIYLPGSTFHLDSIDLDFSVDDVYRRLRY